MFFYWDEWNTWHVAKHDVSREDAAFVANSAKPPFPQEIGDEKTLVRGQTNAGRYLQVIYVARRTETVDLRNLSAEQVMIMQSLEYVGYVIHARDLTEREKRNLRRRRD